MQAIYELKLIDFKLMVDLAETHSIRELARRQSVHPSQISKNVKKIEEKLGISILQRSSQRVSFTLEGMQFLKIAHKMLEISQELNPKANEVDAMPAALTMSSLSFVNQFLLPECLTVLRKDHKDLRLRLLEIPSKDLLVSGIKGLFEMSLHLGKLDWPRTWTTKKVGVARSGLFARAGHSLGTKSTMSKIQKERFVIPLRWSSNGLQAGDDSCPLPVTQRQQGDGAMTAGVALGLIQRSDQIAFLPHIVAREAIRKKEVVEIKVEEWGEISEPLYLSVHSEKVAQKFFLNFVSQLEKRL